MANKNKKHPPNVQIKKPDTTAKKNRADVWLVERGLAESREKAKALIMAGVVLAGTRRIDKAGDTLSEADAATLTLKGNAALPYVSRGGLKLEKALDDFGINPQGWLALDVGASTGGFTDCLLQRGARKVIALDVGHSQLAWSLRQDKRVYVLDKTNIRYVDSLPEVEEGVSPTLVDLVVIDVSFISLKLVLPAVRKLMQPTAPVVCLIKPQFEAGKSAVGKGGIIKDPKVHRHVLEDLVKWFSDNSFSILGLIRSPIYGTEGNTEFLAHLSLQPGSPAELARISAQIDTVVSLEEPFSPHRA
jgi:23S rRNA (cytidine1920-2'-O)/16S rRNA (cytidine1409-2'-O)-methyltransferase